MPEKPVGCAKPAGTVVGAVKDKKPPTEGDKVEGVMDMVTVRVGEKAPDFDAPAYNKGKFLNVKLSDYAGKWVLLCFYPGDFTFV